MASPIAESLRGLTQYLVGENQRIKQDRLKQQAEISASRVAEKFKSLSPDTDEAGVRALTYDLIRDAADLESLDSSLPLISSLYSDSLRSIEQNRKLKQDNALKDYLTNSGLNAPAGVSGQDALDLARFEQSSISTVQSFDEKGRSVQRRYDRKGNIIPGSELVLDPRTDEEKARAKAEIDWEYDQKRIKLQAAVNAAEANRDRPTGMVTAEGLPLSFGNGVYKVPLVIGNGDVKMVPYAGPVNKGSASRLTGNRAIDVAREQDVYQQAAKNSWNLAQDQASNVLNELGIPVPTDAQGKYQVSPVTILKRYTAKDIYSRINKLDIEKERKESIRQSYGLYGEFSKQNLENLKQANKAPQLIELRYALDANKMSVDNFNEYYDVVRQGLMTKDSKLKDFNSYLRKEVESASGKTLTDMSGETYYNAWNELTNTKKVAIMTKLRSKLERK